MADSVSSGPEITFVGPTIRTLPTELEFLSPAGNLSIGIACSTGSSSGPNEPCEPHLLAREGPDSTGLYHFRFALPTAAPGEVHIEAQARRFNPLEIGHLQVILTAITSGISFGDIQTCLMPGTNAAGEAALELGYYSQMSSTAVVFRQERVGRRWATPKLKALANYPVGGSGGWAEPYMRRTLRFRVNGRDLASGRVRLLYFVMKGNHPTLQPKQRAHALERAHAFSSVACLPPGGI